MNNLKNGPWRRESMILKEHPQKQKDKLTRKKFMKITIPDVGKETIRSVSKTNGFEVYKKK